MTRFRYTIRRIMSLIAVVAALLALSRYPFALGLVVAVGGTALFVAQGIRRGRHDLIAWLIIVYPALPLLTLYAHWGLATRKLVRRSSPVFDGLIGLSDVGGLLCLFAYVACVSLVAGAAAERARDSSSIKKAAWRVVILMPIAWATLIAFALWDPLGMLGYFIR